MPLPLDETAVGGEQPPPGPEPRPVRRDLRARALDWLLGAVALLVLLLLLVGAVWLSISRPAGEAGPTADPGSTSATRSSTPPAGAATPPPGLTREQVWLGDVKLDSASLVAAGTPLLDVEGSGRDVTSGQDGITAAWVRLTGTVPFSVVAAELGPDTVVGRAGGEEVRVTRTVELFGRDIDLIADGTVTVADGRLVMVPTSIQVEGGGFLSTILTELARTFVTIEHEIEGLPEGLVLHEVDIVDDGFRATLEGTDVLLTQ